MMLMGLHWGIYSVLYANILFAAIICLLNGLAIRKHLRYRQEIKRTFLIPALAAAVMGAAAYGSYQACFCSLKTARQPRFWQCAPEGLSTAVCF